MRRVRAPTAPAREKGSAWQKKYADAEPLLLQSYEGLTQREAKIPANLNKSRLGATLGL
jgi:hypothetical protein